MKVLVKNTCNTGKDGVENVICNYFKVMDLSNFRRYLVKTNRPDKDIFEPFQIIERIINQIMDGYLVVKKMPTLLLWQF